MNNQVLGQIINSNTNSSQVSSSLETGKDNSNNNQLNSAGNSQKPVTTIPTEATLATILDRLNMHCSRHNNSLCVECYPSYYLNN